ncbi:MAG: hypothetical protein EPO10_25665 [Reyranella sp.]|uniref:hypothetical protein n=1 Tax=Reyranella sp. TaxID=1929291 RepID=UPI00121D1360|nr:hypothetical protein [Reyranella sp.]TAJ88715.1 MAG: hypothetical protein EPO41_20075 [Reyranella sp.]TBR24368.1 MAG: hypothetical protein EPO10_25665 [Reyranella sp.]
MNGAALRLLAFGSLGYASSLAKNAMKGALGRPSHFTADDILFRHYVRQLIGRGRIDRITCIASTHEGAGSQSLMTMRAIEFARAHGLTYVHTPFTEIHHADRPMHEWAAAWETHFNLGADEATVRDTDAHDAVNFAFTFPMLRALFGVEDEDLPFDEALVRDFRRKYYLNKTPRADTPPSICIHVRRRNRHDAHSQHATDMACLVRVVAQVRTILSTLGVDHTLRVFSQGDPADFSALGIPESQLFLDADPFWSMREMIEADLLVTTRGTFGHVTGLLCDGIVLADGLLPTQRGWLTYDAGGGFDTPALVSEVSAKMRSASGR